MSLHGHAYLSKIMLATNHTKNIYYLLNKWSVMLKRNDEYQVQVYARPMHATVRDYKTEDFIFFCSL